MDMSNDDIRPRHGPDNAGRPRAGDAAPADAALDLTPLAADMDRRAARIAAVLERRVAQARARGMGPHLLREEVSRTLARLAIPGALLAAASLGAVLLSGKGSPRSLDRFAGVVLGRGPAAEWVVLDHRPTLQELVAAIRATR